ncbi:MAG TPA: carboxypeptidase-like regulatory domain-containing protein [Candidatus Solibacter sp.]|nr:carboxypeptidase-like regulatory domain-containing protein [Candidatus Solibacter sp.]
MRSLTAITLLFPLAISFAQLTTTGSLSGSVSDPQGAAVPKAQITVTNPLNGQRFTAEAGERGDWTVPSLPTAVYEATVSSPGFKTAKLSAIKIDPGVPATLNVTLELGAVAETVEVQGGAEVLQTTTATVSSTLVGRQLSELPFTSRNLTELLVTQPGTSTPGIPRSSSVNGLPRGAMNVTIDGVNVQDNSFRISDGFFQAVQPRQDVIEEVTITTAAAGADSSGEGAAQVKFVTKSGTNLWRGGLFWQTRNTFFNANYYFNNINGLPRDRIILNQVGGQLGGPIRRNRIFFFVAYDASRLPQSYPGARTILTDTARQGVFTYLDTATRLPRTANLFQLAAAANGSLPAGVKAYATSVDPILANSFDQIARLTSSGGTIKSRAASNSDYNRNDYNYQTSGANNRDFPLVRFDFNATQNHHVEVVWNYQNNVRLPDGANNVIPVYAGTGTVLNTDVNTGLKAITFTGVVALRSVLTPRITNELRAGVQGGTVWFQGAIGPPLFQQWRGYAPVFGFISNPYTSNGTSSRNTPVHQYSDNLTWLRGPHVLSFGGELTQVNLWQKVLNTQAIPTITFGVASNDPVNFGSTSLFTAANFPNSTATNLSDAASMYALLTGRVSAINRTVALGEDSKQYGSNPTIDRNRYRQIALHVQDSWRARPSLTLNFGVRWEKPLSYVNQSGIYTRPTYAGLFGISGVGNLFRPGVLSGSVPQFFATDEDTKAYLSTNKNFAPSAGFAWTLPKASGPLSWLLGKGQAVIRGGFAISTIRPDAGAFSGAWGNNQGRSLSVAVDPTNQAADFGAPGSVLFRDPTLPARAFPATPVYPLPVLAGNSVRDFDPTLRTEYVESWTIGFQRELTRDTVLEVRYVANHDVGAWRTVNLNETNIFENGFLNEFNIAANNLAIARATNSTSTNFGNAGLPGQRDVPILLTALGAANDTTIATQLAQGQAGAVANSIANNATRMARLTAAGRAANLFWVNPTATGGSQLTMNGGSATYNAMQVELRRRLSAGLLIQGSYVWSHALSNLFANGTGGSPTTLRDQALDKGPTPWDIRHAFKLNWIYELPFGSGRRFFSRVQNPVARKALEGWQLASVSRIQSGSPEPLTSGRNTFNQNESGVVLYNLTTSQLQDAMSIRKVTNANGIGAVYYLPQALVDNSLAAFEVGGKTLRNLDPSQPYVGPPTAPGQLGYKIFLYGPWQQRLDYSLLKRTRITESKNIEFRMNVLNAFNFQNFILSGGIRDPANNIGLNGNFGQTTNSYRDLANTNDPGARLIEFVLKFNF